MSYLAKFKGKFEFKDLEAAQKALEVIDEEAQNPDDSERNILSKGDFTLATDKPILSINFDNFIPASCWFGCQRVICKISATAIKGVVTCSFEGDPDEKIRAGRGWS